MSTISSDRRYPQLSEAADLEALYAALEPLSMGPGWAKKKPAMWPEPRPTYLPMHWSWHSAHAAFQAAAHLVSTELAERRNLILYNPVDENHYATARTLIAAYQMIKPGEKARSHRHAANALRLVLQGKGAYTVVDGERLEMEAGDVVLTPGAAWHGHGCEGEENCYWLDYLDVPLVQLTEAMYFEGHPEGFERINSTQTRSPFLFRWRDTSVQLRDQQVDREIPEGRVLELDAAPVRSMRLYLQGLQDRQPTTRLRRTANQIFTVVEGSGVSRVGDRELHWQRGDVFVVPGWVPYHHQAAADATLFCVSDERMQRLLGFYRQQLEENRN